MKLLFAMLSIVGAVFILAYLPSSNTAINDNLPTGEKNQSNVKEMEFLRYGLGTDTSKASIPLSQVLSGGPGKDGIPAINDPKFVSISEADVFDETLGVLISIDREKRFYPYNILVWHEVVNDSIGTSHFAVTFCPLCGSAIVFDRQVGDEVLTFGVSGLLYESNLLMYDTKTESLWSQAGNKAVVGDFTGTNLNLVDMRLLTFGTLKELHSGASILSRDTGFSRNYDVDPYIGYDSTDDLFFPVSISDKRFPAKQIMYVIPIEGASIAFPEADLENESVFAHQGSTLVAKRLKDGIEVTLNSKFVPGYYEMWFSWATQHEEDGVVWSLL